MGQQPRYRKRDNSRRECGWKNRCRRYAEGRGRGRGQNASKSTATLTKQTTGGDSMIQVTEQRSQRCCSSNESAHERGRYWVQSAKPEQARIPQELKRLLDLGRNPFLDHWGNHTESASLGSGHNKDRLHYRPTERHPINSTDPRNREPSTTVRELPGTGQGQRGATVGTEEEEDQATTNDR